MTLEGIKSLCTIDEKGCWNWTKSRNFFGYGWIWFGEKLRKTHRVVYSIVHNEELTREDFVCHSCDNPSCCNPEHLFLGNHDENMKDMVDKKRSGRREDHSQAKLTFDQVREIRQKYRSMKISQRGLAKQYGVDQALICKIIQNKLWKED